MRWSRAARYHEPWGLGTPDSSSVMPVYALSAAATGLRTPPGRDPFRARCGHPFRSPRSNRRKNPPGPCYPPSHLLKVATTLASSQHSGFLPLNAPKGILTKQSRNGQEVSPKSLCSGAEPAKYQVSRRSRSVSHASDERHLGTPHSGVHGIA